MNEERLEGLSPIAYAHSKENAGPELWHRLDRHLCDVAERARRYAEPWDAGDLTFVAGLWHDIGKYAPDWQAFLREVGKDASATDADPDQGNGKRPRGPDHSSAGAMHARATLGENTPFARLISFVIAGHHCGLADFQALRSRLSRPELCDRYARVVATADPNIVAPPDSILRFRERFSADTKSDPSAKDARNRSFELLVRMTFSALTDADFLDTEAFSKSAAPEQKTENRQGWYPLERYDKILTSYLDSRAAEPETPVVAQRRSILTWCRTSATGPRGAYTLTAPTGAGKTLSSLAFALRHAATNGQERVVVALPFLSILDQTASVFREIFSPQLGDRVLVEHHSSITPEIDTDANRVASENWDAPLIVTTQVQLFDSLFSNRSAACRKLHNLANSVVVLDEVQSLPSGLLDPILDVLQELRCRYGTTLLLMTATQPSLHRRAIGGWPEPKPWLDPAPIEIVPVGEQTRLFTTLERVRVEWPVDETPIEWRALAERIADCEQILAIVHRRADARALWREVEALAPGTIHLSALMCPAHRREVLEHVRRRLQEGATCRVVSTQLVEAGVDVDFPVVFRAMAGFEALAQSAGRCNREGKLDGLGRFVVYNAPTPPPGLLQHHLEVAKAMRNVRPEVSLTSPETFRAYFDRLYSVQKTDSKGVQALREALKFEEVARTFRMIDEAAITVFVPWGKAGHRAINELRFAGPGRERFRALQPFGVAVYPNVLRDLQQLGLVEQLHESVWCLVSEASYHPVFGLDLEPEEFQSIVV